MKVGIGADHGGFELKEQLIELLREHGYDVVNFGNTLHDPDDDYPDFAIPLASAVANHQVDRGVLVCGSGVGVCIAASKVPGVYAAVCHDDYSAHQGVEDDNMNVICLGGRTIGVSTAWSSVRSFLIANFSGAERHRRRVAKVTQLEILSFPTLS
jgi:ribose 5-phosphate isomerase B